MKTIKQYNPSVFIKIKNHLSDYKIEFAITTIHRLQKCNNSECEMFNVSKHCEYDK